MADLTGITMDTTEEISSDFELIPSGDYPAIIEDSEMKENRAGTGSYLSLEFTLMGDSYAGRKLWAILNLVHPNEKAVAFAKRDLSAICKAIGVKDPKDSIELHDKPLIITVGQEERRDACCVDDVVWTAPPRTYVSGVRNRCCRPAVRSRRARPQK